MRYNIKFLQTGGVPLTNDLMDTLQEAYSIFNTLGDLSGHLTILSGCNVTGQNVSPGIVAINGDVLFFEGGIITSTVFINNEEITKTFQDTTDKVLVEKKTVKFGLSTTVYNWSDFVRLETLKAIQIKVNNSVSIADFNLLKNRVEILEMKTAPFQNGGIALPWFKQLSEIPIGWKECLDLRGKTIVGLDPNDATFSTLNSNVGAKTHTLTIAEMPPHKHKVPLFANGSASGNAIGHPDNYIDYNRTIDSETVGGNQPHNNIQPSRIAYYIEPNFQ